MASMFFFKFYVNMENILFANIGLFNIFRLAVKSAYAELYNGEEPPFTTWKVREDGEHCDTLDYIFHNK